MSGYTVRKLGYSAKPWRIVVDTCPNGAGHRNGRCVCEVWTPAGFDHPYLGLIAINEPLAYDRKRDGVAALAALLAVPASQKDQA